MAAVRQKYVVNQNGRRVGVLLDIEEYRKLLEELEELESIRAYDAAKASKDEAVPFEQAVEEIEKEGESVGWVKRADTPCPGWPGIH